MYCCTCKVKGGHRSNEAGADVREKMVVSPMLEPSTGKAKRAKSERGMWAVNMMWVSGVIRGG